MSVGSLGRMTPDIPWETCLGALPLPTDLSAASHEAPAPALVDCTDGPCFFFDLVCVLLRLTLSGGPGSSSPEVTPLLAAVPDEPPMAPVPCTRCASVLPTEDEVEVV